MAVKPLASPEGREVGGGDGARLGAMLRLPGPCPGGGSGPSPQDAEAARPSWLMGLRLTVWEARFSAEKRLDSTPMDVEWGASYWLQHSAALHQGRQRA
ncbi:hypothetical protein AB1Y20_010359 [Prymnesium parvum]|uniref:Uncharacterized protein n=1 Tax=Prymnesium parvum TaxID=97485 RepID=A0AB34IPK6_PRYPA